MRRGHRRTQSANLNNHLPEPPPPTNNQQPQPTPAVVAQNRNNIVQLLSKCEEKVKEKVCTVDQLESPLPTDQDPLFNFGKGMLKGAWEQQRREWQEQELRAIPEKQRQGVGRARKGESESQGKKRQRSTLQSVLKTSNREVSKNKIPLPFNEAVDKIIRDKIGLVDSLHAKKASFYEGGFKMQPKANRHRKAPSLK